MGKGELPVPTYDELPRLKSLAGFGFCGRSGRHGIRRWLNPSGRSHGIGGTAHRTR
jgi:hypothetical protein